MSAGDAKSGGASTRLEVKNDSDARGGNGAASELVADSLQELGAVQREFGRNPRGDNKGRAVGFSSIALGTYLAKMRSTPCSS